MPADDFSSTIYHVLYGTREEVLKCSLQVSPLLADFAQMHCVIAKQNSKRHCRFVRYEAALSLHRCLALMPQVAATAPSVSKPATEAFT
jgi:hypothetical protein